MAPRYETDIPSEASEEYEKFVNSLKGVIVTKFLTPQEKDEEMNRLWLPQVEEVRSLTHSLLYPPSPLEKRRILRGLVRFVSVVVSNPSYRDSSLLGREDIDWNNFRDSLGAVIYGCLPENVPDYITLNSENTRFIRKDHSGYPQPQHLSLFMRNYGLHGDKPTSISTLAREQGLNVTTVQRTIQNVVHEIGSYETISRQLFRKPEEL